MSDPAREEITRWVQEQVGRFDRVRERYELYAQILDGILQKAAKKLSPLAIVQARAKSVASFAGKLVRKRPLYWPPRDPLTEITDLCGARVITHTAEEVRAVCQFIETHFEIDWENSDDVSGRLRPTEFGYRSVHYIVLLRPGAFPTRDVPVEIPAELFEGIPPAVFAESEATAYPLKAEVQVRTILEHAWADISHDLTYKSDIRIPDRVVREVAALAAVLESADREFGRILEGLRAYASNYGAYLKPEQVKSEVQTLELTLQHDRTNAELATRIAALAMTIDDWAKAIEVLRPYQASGYQPALRSLGIALCRQHERQANSAEYLEGRRLLEEASAPPHKDPEALCALADTWQAEDEDRARQLYRQAFELEPSHPRYLASYLEFEIACHRNAMIIPLLTPTIVAACQRCRNQIEAGVELPWAYAGLAMFQLLLNQPYNSLAALAKAIQLCTTPRMLESAAKTLKRLQGIADKLPGYDWVWKLLLLGQATKYQDAGALDKLRTLASSGCPPVREPVVLVAGGCDRSVEAQMQGYRQMLLEAFHGFAGTVISGGTRQGIVGLVGDVRQHHGSRMRVIGYIPHFVPADATPDRNPARYDELRETRGSGFTALEPLQNWIDLVTSGIDPSQVKVVGINGGSIATVEYRIAAALGARVGLLDESGRAAARMLSDPDWEDTPNLMRLPADPMTVRAFVSHGKSGISDEACEQIAQEIHEAFRRNKARTRPSDPALADWHLLPETLQKSNLSQARHIIEKLREIRCHVRPLDSGPAPEFSFTDEEVDHLADMEHGRWNIERFLDGWRYGEKRDVERKLSPYLVPWQDLSDDIKQWDVAAVREIPRLLAKVGLCIVRQAAD